MSLSHHEWELVETSENIVLTCKMKLKNRLESDSAASILSTYFILLNCYVLFHNVVFKNPARLCIVVFTGILGKVILGDDKVHA